MEFMEVKFLGLEFAMEVTVQVIVTRLCVFVASCVLRVV